MSGRVEPAEAVDRYRRWLASVPLAERSKRDYARNVEAFCGWLAGQARRTTVFVPGGTGTKAHGRARAWMISDQGELSYRGIARAMGGSYRRGQLARAAAASRRTGPRVQACWQTQRKMSVKPAFATDDATRRYYDQRAREYDDWYTGHGVFTDRDPVARTLDVAVRNGIPDQASIANPRGRRDLCGFVVGLDQQIVDLVERLQPQRAILAGLSDRHHRRALDRERAAFLNEARRVAGEFVVVDSARREDAAAGRWETRVLSDGSQHRVYKRYLSADQLALELDGAPLFDGRWFAAARVSWSERAGCSARRDS